MNSFEYVEEAAGLRLPVSLWGLCGTLAALFLSSFCFFALNRTVVPNLTRVSNSGAAGLSTTKPDQAVTSAFTGFDSPHLSVTLGLH